MLSVRLRLWGSSKDLRLAHSAVGLSHRHPPANTHTQRVQRPYFRSNSAVAKARAGASQGERSTQEVSPTAIVLQEATSNWVVRMQGHCERGVLVRAVASQGAAVLECPGTWVEAQNLAGSH